MKKEENKKQTPVPT